MCNTRSTIPTEPIVFANFQSPNMTATYAALVDDAGRRLGRPSELVEGTSLEQLRQGLVDVAFVCGLPYVTLETERPGALRLIAAPILLDGRCAGKPVYFSDVVVLQGSAYRAFGDLRGARWAHTDPGSFSGCLATRCELSAMGESEVFFGQVTHAGTHQRALQMVISGEADAAAIDSHVLAVERRTRPELDQLRVVASFGPAPIPPVVATRGVSAVVAAQLQEILCSMGNDPQMRPILEGGMIHRFVRVADGDYDDIRRKRALVERSGAAV